MYSKAKRYNLDFRPHFKTHQSLEIGQWFKELGTDKITVSSMEMGNYFATEWNDITVAFPVNILEIESINHLASKIQLNLLVESIETVGFLKKNLASKVGLFIKIDVGYHRTGIDPANTEKIDDILTITDSSEKLEFKGFLAHAGHTYKCRTHKEITTIHNASLVVMKGLKYLYEKKYPQLITSLGDTPSCSVSEKFSGIDEIRPGNFVFYDLTQNRIGSNSIEEIAVAMACPIVAIHKDRAEIVVYGGGVHFSKDRLENEEEGTVFGRVVEKLEQGWGNIIEGAYVESLSQEHGIIVVPASEISKYRIGDCIIVLPIHSCMTANAMKSYVTTCFQEISRL